MDMIGQAIDGGFADPVLDGQSVFRAVMDAMARPGTVQPIGYLAAPPAPLAPTAAAVALTLCDHDTPLWLDPALQASEAAKTWLGFHTGAPLALNPAEAHFALVSNPAGLIALENFAQGTQEYPDRSATLILAAESLTSGPKLRLEGPGIETKAVISPVPLPRHFVEQWKQNNGRFPRGIDVILSAPGHIACLPRTTRITTMEA
jgi:alpha-D-ribose 1-methylphosphonate 5-triphosphate synthase subunit PhnH